MHWSEIRFYCPFRDANMTRIYAFDAKGGEFWQAIPTAPGGRARREARERALDAIEMAIEQGCEPGEVVLCET